MPDNPVIIRDGGALCLWNMAFNTTASSDMHWCENFGHLRTGIPHAIGAQLAVGDSRRVVNCKCSNHKVFSLVFPTRNSENYEVSRGK